MQDFVNQQYRPPQEFTGLRVAGMIGGFVGLNSRISRNTLNPKSEPSLNPKP